MVSARPHLLAVGGAHVDRRGMTTGPYVAGVSNPGTMREEIGGGAFNALSMAARQGVSGAMFSLRGGDAAGAAVSEAIADAGLADLSAVFLDRATPSYTALLEADGNLVAGLADMGLYELAFEKQMRRRALRDALDGADAVLADANLPEAALARLTAEAGRRRRPVYAIAVSPAKVVRMAGLLGSFACLFMNGREAAALGVPHDAGPKEAAAVLRAAGLAAGVVTHGGGQAVAFSGGDVFTLAPPPVRDIVDVTGAGDALAGAAVAALMQGAGFAEAVRNGLAAAALVVASPSARPAVTREEIAAVLPLVGEPERVA